MDKQGIDIPETKDNSCETTVVKQKNRYKFVGRTGTKR